MVADNNPRERAADELAHDIRELLGGFWLPFGKGTEPLPEYDVIAGFTKTLAGRRVLTGLFVSGAALTSDALRRIPIAELENVASLSNKETRNRLENEVRSLPPLRRDSCPSADAFSQLVARHYNAWSALVPHPAPAIAAAQEANIATVHTWIREARLRGYITTGTRRKASRVEPT